MPSSPFMMWGMLLVMAFGAVAGPLVHGNVWGTIHAAYPAEEAKRAALRYCSAIDAEFSRFSAQDRDLCYRAVLRGAAEPSMAGS